MLTLVGKPECRLCDEMREVAQRVVRESRLRLVELDVRDHPALEKRYLFEIPVLLLEGREIARHRASEEELRERLVDYLRS